MRSKAATTRCSRTRSRRRSRSRSSACAAARTSCARRCDEARAASPDRRRAAGRRRRCRAGDHRLRSALDRAERQCAVRRARRGHGLRGHAGQRARVERAQREGHPVPGLPAPPGRSEPAVRVHPGRRQRGDRGRLRRGQGCDDRPRADSRGARHAEGESLLRGPAVGADRDGDRRSSDRARRRRGRHEPSSGAPRGRGCDDGRRLRRWRARRRGRARHLQVRLRRRPEHLHQPNAAGSVSRQRRADREHPDLARARRSGEAHRAAPRRRRDVRRSAAVHRRPAQRQARSFDRGAQLVAVEPARMAAHRDRDEGGRRRPRGVPAVARVRRPARPPRSADRRRVVAVLAAEPPRRSARARRLRRRQPGQAARARLHPPRSGAGLPRRGNRPQRAALHGARGRARRAGLRCTRYDRRCRTRTRVSPAASASESRPGRRAVVERHLAASRFRESLRGCGRAVSYSWSSARRSEAFDSSLADMQAALTHDKLTRVSQLARAITDEVGRAFIGSPHTTEALLPALLARGHVLIEGYPGVAKTTLVKAFSATLGCHFRRIQFTPDLLPSDNTGTYILDMRTNTFVLREGPVFTHVLLGDEINRAPAQAQSALLEAMQEQQVTIEGETRSLAEPFIVLATQNPIEQEGTYPLPEAQVYLFLIKLKMGYPQAADEKRMLLTYDTPPPPVRAVVGPNEVLEMQALAQGVYVAEELVDYVLALVAYTRAHARVSLLNT